MKTKKAVSHLHHEHQEWINKLEFYKDELKIFQNRLDEIATKNTGKSVMQEVEHFQNQFLIHKNKIQNLKHEINREERQLLIHSAADPEKATQGSIDFNREEREQIRTFEKIFVDLRHEFNSFLVKAM